MKKTLGLIAIGLALLCASVHAQEVTPPAPAEKPWYANPIGFAQHTSDAKSLTLAVYPSYAPGIVTDGKKDQFGFGAALLYPVMADTLGGHGFVGGRIDFLGSQFWAPSATLGAQADVQLFGHNIRVHALGGTIFPLSGAGDKNGAVGGILGTGFSTTLAAFKKDETHPDGRYKLSVFGATEKWTIFPGLIYHGGVALTASF